MFMRKFLFAMATLALAAALSSCPDDGPVTKKEEEKALTVAKPIITDQSGSRRYMTGSEIQPLSVTAAASDGGALTYQWYSINSFANSGGEAISGAAGASYAPAVSAGTAYFYAVVTNPAKGRTPAATTASAPMGVIIIDSLPSLDYTVTVTDTEQQYVRGFGGMSNAFGINPEGVARYMEMRDIETMFGPGGLGLNFLRIMIWPNTLQEVISGQVQPQMRNNTTYLQAVKRVNALGGYVYASPWTPPDQYKTNAQARGHLKTEMYADYAMYLRDFASEMARNGAPIYAISIQNEPSLEVGYAGMEWTAAEQMSFLRDYGDKISRSPTAVKGWGAGKEQPHVLVSTGEAHQVGGWHTGAMSALVGNATAVANTDIVAYHIYGGSGTNASVTSNNAWTKEHWMTEYNINTQSETTYYLDSTWNYAWRFAETVHHAINVNKSNAYIWWYAKRFYSFVGDGSYGTVNGAVMPRGYIISHYAKYATDTVQVAASTTYPAANTDMSWADGESTTTGRAVRLAAFKRAKTSSQIMADEDSYSVVLYDQRTSAGAGAPLRVALPAGFAATRVTGIISASDDRRHAPVDVILNPDGASADVTLPQNAIISLKFAK